MRLVAYLLAALGLIALASPTLAVDERGKFPKQFTMSPKGVNVQTGRFSYSKVDLSVGDLALTRIWGDQPAYVPPNSRVFGLNIGYAQSIYGWNHTYNQGVSISGANNFRVIVEGQQYQFGLSNASADPLPIGRTSAGTYLRKSGLNWLFTDRSGAVYSFAPHPAINQFGDANKPNQVVAQTTRPDGTVLTYSYRSTGQLEEVRSSRGYAIHFDFSANNNISKACSYNLAVTHVEPATPCQASAPSVSYGYDGGAANLVSVTGTGGEVVTISSTSFGTSATAPVCITIANSATCEVTNTYANSFAPEGCLRLFPNQVTRQVAAGGGVWEYCYEPPENPADVPYVPGRPRWSSATMKDALGQQHSFDYDRGRLVEHVSPWGIWNYKYPATVINIPYNFGGITFEYMDVSPGVITALGGAREYYIYDPRGNVLIRSRWLPSAADPLLANGSPALSSDPEIRKCCIAPGVLQIPPGSLTVGEAFPASLYLAGPYVIGCGAGEADAKLCDKPILRIDERGNQTDFTYDPAHGGILTETLPAVNGVRPQTRYSYAQRNAWVKTAGGGYAQSGPLIWVLTQKSLCKTTAASGAGCAGGASDEVRTTYDYGPDSGPNNLLLRGVVDDATGLSLRTCHGYDWQGNKISETKPQANLASCP